MTNTRKDTPKQSQLKIVTWDIETTPVTAYSWDLYPNAISHDSIVQDWSIICSSWKYLGNPKIYATAIKDVGDDYEVVKTTRDILAAADIIVGHNIDKFDVRKLKARIAYHKISPLPKLITIDTRKVAKEVGGFTSNRLDYLGKFLLGQGKMHVDYQLWLDIMNGSKTAVKKMVEYNKVDVVRNEEIYLHLRPYMNRHPHVAVIQNGHKLDCPKCGSTSLQKRGFAITLGGNKQQRLQCNSCGGWHNVPLKAIKSI